MNILFKLVFFSIALNFAMGLMSTAFGIDVSTLGTGMSVYDNNVSADFNASMSRNIEPSGTVENKGNALFRILDMLTIGWFHNIMNAVDKYMFSFINLMAQIFNGSVIGESTHTAIFNILKAAMAILYGVAAFYLWTGRSLTENI